MEMILCAEQKILTAIFTTESTENTEVTQISVFSVVKNFFVLCGGGRKIHIDYYSFCG